MMKHSYVYRNINHVGNLNKARLSGKLCDVTIKVNEKEFRAHKIILAANLNYFESMFLNSFHESQQDVIDMHGVDESNFDALITFAYTGEILITDTNALELLEVANYLTEDGVEKACINFLEKHLKMEDAFRAYKLSTLLGYSSLKNVAKQTILSNFSDCSQTTVFVNLDFESLKDILSDASLDLVETQEMFFEIVIRWILHSPTIRRAHVNDLLSLIDITKLKASYLLEYFCKRIRDQRGIVQDIMSFYYTKTEEKDHKSESMKPKLLMVISNGGTKLNAQYYDFGEKKWSETREVVDHVGKGIGPGIILNETYYYTVYENSNKMNLHAFHPTTGRDTVTLFENRLLRHSAKCACSKFLYFCGGLTKVNTASDQVLRYDPSTNSLETLAPLGFNRSGAPAIFYQGCIFVLGGWDGSGQTNVVEKYEPITRKWTAFPSMCEPRYFCAAAVLDEKLYVCGGWKGSRSVEVYDLSTKCWRLIASMNKGRRDFLLIAREGKLLAVGGDIDETVEVYDPLENQWQIDSELSSGLQIEYPQGGLITLN